MRIGLVCPYNITKSGGVQEGILAIQHELARRGHTAKIITPLPRDIDTAQWPDVIFIGTATDVKSPFATTAQVSVSLRPDEIDNVLTKEQFDILHFHEPWVPIMSRQLLVKSSSINVATFHARLPDTIVSKSIETVITPYTKPLLRYIDGLTAVSEAAADYVRGLTNRSVEIIPNGIDLTKYKQQKAKRTKAAKTVLFIGRLEKRKGVPYLLDAWTDAQTKVPGCRLVIAGDGSDRKRLERQAQKMGLHSVEFVGFVDDDQKMKLLAEADLFCSPALYGESFGIVLLEAMAAGVPIVAGNNPGYASVMRGVGDISLVDPTDVSAFGRRLVLLLENEELRKTWQAWAKDYVKQFDYAKVVDKYEKLYKKLKERK